MRTITSSRVTVFAERRGDKAKIEWKHHSLREQAAQHEQVCIRVIVEFVATTLRCLNDGFANGLLFVEFVGKMG